MNDKLTELRQAHSDRFRKVANRYPRRVAEAYGGDIERAARDSDRRVAATVASFERSHGLDETDWAAVERGKAGPARRRPMSETKAEKASRLIAEGRVHRQLELPDGGTVWRVQGDSKKIRTVTVDAEGSAMCDCPFLGSDCAHTIAVLGTVGIAKSGAADAPTVETTTVASGEVEILDPEQPITTVDMPDAALVARTSSGTADLATGPVTWETLEVLSRTEFVPGALRGKPAAVLGAVLMGREFGLGPLEALRSIDVIDGSPTPNAELLLRLYRRAGHTLEMTKADDQAVTVAGTRGDTGEKLTVSFTVDDALKAGLIDRLDDNGKPVARSNRGKAMPWEAYTADLLWARAVTRLVRRLAPDALDAGLAYVDARPTGS